jgi:hypothetical protein
MIRIRNNGTIREIEIPHEKLEVIQKTLESNVSQIVKDSIVRRFGEGRCCICGTLATQIVTFDASDDRQSAHKIEKYCDNCVKKVYEREPVL